MPKPMNGNCTTGAGFSDVHLDVRQLPNLIPQTDLTMYSSMQGGRVKRVKGIRTLSDAKPEVPAVAVKDACKMWKSSKILALDNCTITVDEGTIYGLLGPSGCGKTTLLNSIVGLAKLDSGTLSVFGMKPGTRESGIPGRLVGFMPQELALYPVFTVRESLSYFGTLGGMNPYKIKERTEFLLNFLALSKPDQRVGSLSGGQQRRVSLAVALINAPPLLILDEPTVGVDPMLRKNIWKYLLTLCKEENSTIIITTHYIEEASRAHRVGLMRKGQILEEASPSALLTFYRKSNLEDVFLHICECKESNSSSTDDLQKSAEIYKGRTLTNGAILNNGKVNRSKSLTNGLSNGCAKKGVLNRSYISEDSELTSVQVVEAFDKAATQVNPGHRGRSASSELPPYPREPSPDYMDHSGDYGVLKRPRRIPKKRPRVSLKAMKALMKKNIVTVIRNVFLLLFELGIPPVQIALFALTIGSNPHHLPVAIYNAEVSSPEMCANSSYYYSCDFIYSLDTSVVTKIWTNSSEEAQELVLQNKAWAMVVIPENFSSFLIDRFLSGADVKAETINGSTIDLRLDMSSQTIAALLAEEFLKAYQYFMSFLIKDVPYEVAENFASLPLNFGEPIYGEREPRFAEFMAPGMLTALGYFMSLGLTALSFVQERKQGLLNRSVVSGVTYFEILMGHVFTQFFIMALQNILALIFLLGIFSIPNRGSLALVIILTLIQGLCGMTFGLLISAFTKEEATAQIIALGVFFPTLLLTGIVWPREAMSPWMQTATGLLPQTHGIEGLRAIMSRGHGIEDFAVQLAFIGPTIWTFLHIVWAWLVVGLRK